MNKLDRLAVLERETLEYLDKNCDASYISDYSIDDITWERINLYHSINPNTHYGKIHLIHGAVTVTKYKLSKYEGKFIRKGDADFMVPFYDKVLVDLICDFLEAPLVTADYNNDPELAMNRLVEIVTSIENHIKSIGGIVLYWAE